MKRFLTSSTAIALLVAALLAPTAVGAPAEGPSGVLSVIPGDAWGFVVVNRLAETMGKVEDVGKQMGAPMPSLLAMAKLYSGLSEGVDETGSVVALVLPPAADDQRPGVVIAVPVKDYDRLLKTLAPENAQAEFPRVSLGGKPAIVARRGDYAIFGEPEKPEVLKRVLASTTGIEKSVAPLATWLSEREVAVLITPGGMLQALGAAQKGLQQGERGLPDDANAQSAKRSLDLLAQGLDAMKTNVSLFGFGLSLDGGGSLLVSGQAIFKQDAPLAQSVRDARWPASQAFDALPAGSFVGAFGLSLPPDWEKAFLKFSTDWLQVSLQGMGKNGPTPEQAKQVAALNSSYAQGFRSLGFVIRPNRPGAPLMSAAANIIMVDSTSEYLKKYQETAKAMADLIEANPSLPLPKTAVKPIEVVGLKGLEIQVDMSRQIEQLKKQPNQAVIAPFMDTLFDKMFGEGGKMTAFLVALDEHTLLSTYGDEEFLAQLRDTARGGKDKLLADPQVIRTLGLLPEGAQWSGYVSPSGFVQFAVGLARSIVPGVVPPLPEFPDTPPIGGAVKFTTQGVELRLVVPGSVFDAAAEFAAKIRALHN